MKQNLENKFSTQFKPQPYTVLNKTGNSVLVQSDQGVKYRRNVTHLKKFHERKNSSAPDIRAQQEISADLPLPEPVSEPSLNLTAPAPNEQNSVNEPQIQTDTTKPYNTRSAAERKVQERFKDFMMDKYSVYNQSIQCACI